MEIEWVINQINELFLVNGTNAQSNTERSEM